MVSRLPSLKPPRDINLGQGSLVPNLPGSTSSASSLFAKPKFAPNLALAGKRTAPAVKEDSTSDSKKNGSKMERNRQMNKRTRKEPEIIQSKGTFSEGFAEGAGSSRSASRDRIESSSMNPRFSGSSNSLSRVGGGSKTGGGDGKLSSRDLHGSSAGDDIETDEDFLACLMKDDFVSDLYSGDMTPISVLVKKDETNFLGLNKSGALDNKMNVDIEPKSQVQHQDMDMFDNSDADTSYPERSSGKYIIIQLPSVLSSMLLEKDMLAKDIKKEIKAEVTNDNETMMPIPDAASRSDGSTTEKRHVLENFSCGPIAKLQFLKSGRIRLKMETDTEPIYMNVDMSTNTFAQELVQLKIDENDADEQSCQMNVIDQNIRRRILIKPDIENFSKSLFR